MNQQDKTLFMQKNVVVFILATICCALWGSAFPCVKIGYSLMNIVSSDIPSLILFAGCRFTLAGIITVIICSLMEKKLIVPRKKAIGKVFILSLFQTILQYILFYIGLAHASGVKASIIDGLNVFVALLVSSLIFKLEKLTNRKILGSIIGFAGVVIMNLAGSSTDMSFNLIGEGFVFLSTVAYAFSSVVMKKFSKEENPIMLSAYQFVFGGIVLILVGLFMGGRIEIVSPASVAMLLYLACVSAVAYSLWVILLKYNPVSKIAIFGFVTPIFGVVLSAVLLNETGTLNIYSIVALIFVCIGIYIVNKPKIQSV